MTIRATHFDPKVLLSAPRRSAGVPNASGDYVLFTVSSYSFESHSKTNEFRLLDTKTNESILLSGEGVDAVNWLDDDSFVWLQSGKEGSTDLWHGSAEGFLKGSGSSDSGHSQSPYVVGSIAAPAGNLKVKALSGDGNEFAVVLSAQADSKGELFNPEKATKTQSTGRLYTGLYVRHWDAYEEKERNALWYGKLSKVNGGKYQLSSLTNALKGSKLESPIRPFGGTDNFDVSEGAVAFVSKDPDLNPALNTTCNVYLLNVGDWAQPSKAKVKKVAIQGFEGASTSPAFSPSGRQLAFLSMRRNGYESDRNWIFMGSNLDAEEVEASHEHEFVACQAAWDRSPSSIAWTAGGEYMLATAEDNGHARLFLVTPGQEPVPITTNGSVGDVVPLAKKGRIFYTGSSLIDNSFFAIIEARDEGSEMQASTLWSHSNSNHGSKFGLKTDQISSIWSPASNPEVNKKVHSWVIKPSNFDSSKKYPVAYLIHGGPQGAWGDSWSTRWNPAVFAEQGFIVITPNITGSTGYGQAFTDAINKNWGGDPLVDIENVFLWVGKHLPEADNDRAVALGASYGGYMMNCKSFPLTYISKRSHSDTFHYDRDPRPPSRPQIQSPGLPRRHLQLRQHAVHRRTLLPALRPRWHTLGSH